MARPNPPRRRTSRRPRAPLGLAAGRAVESLESRLLLTAVDVLTQHNDNNRSGWNSFETTLNTSNVNTATFGRLYSRAVDDEIYAQPLYVAGVNIPGVGTRNVVYVATVSDTVYAFDADDPTRTQPLWKDSFIDPANNVRPVNHTQVGQACGNYVDFSGNIGIVSTPVIDRATNTMYVLARTIEGTAQTFVQRLHALDLVTGAEKFGGPVTIAASVPGTGAGASGGRVAFNSQTENQRAALALVAGNVVLAWASHCDTGPYHGWVMAYSAATLQQSWVLNVTPNGSNGGIWQSGNGPAIDATGNMYFTVGNGTVSPASGQYGEAMLKISPTGQILDYYIPNNYSQLEGGDIDFGSAGALLVPGSHTLISGDKEGKVFVIDANNLGHLNNPDQILQGFQVGPNYGNDKIHGTPVYYKDSAGNQWVYVWASNDKLKQFQFDGTKLTSTTPVHQSQVTVAPSPSMPGGVMAVTSDGSTAGTGILWATTVLSGNANNDVRPGIFRAFDASDVSKELWNSQQNAARDDFGNLAKFNTPTVSNGRVYLPTFSNQLVVYGLLAGVPVAPASMTATASATENTISLTWAAVSGAVQYVIERRSGTSGNYTPLVTLDANLTTYTDANLVAGTTYFYRVRAQNTVGASTPAQASASTKLIKRLVARYKMDENAGTTTADSSGNGNTATLGSRVTWTSAGRFNAGLSFDGTQNAQVLVNDGPSLNPSIQITVSAWVFPTSWAGGNRRILQKGFSDNQYRLTDEGDVLKWDIAGVGLVQTTLPGLNAWHHVVGTYDGSAMRVYIDGAQVASTAATGTIPVTTDGLTIGSKRPGATPGDQFSGTLDEVRIYNYALSTAEITSLFQGTAPAAPTGLALSAPSPSNVTVQWNDVATNEMGYVVERRPASGGVYVQVASLPPGTTAYNDVGLPAFTTFAYRVAAFNTVDPSPYTPEQSVTTQGAALNSLVAWFKLDETSGTTLTDSSGHGVVPALVGSPQHATDTADASPRSLQLNGSTDWAQAPDNAALDMTDGLTLAAWVKADDWSQTRPILQKGGRETHYVLQADGGLLKFDLTNQGTLTAPLPSTGVWHHVAASYDGMTMRIYVDGVQVASRAATGAMGLTPEPFFIGGSHASSSTGLAFDGRIDDARVYNYAIPAADVSAVYGNAAYLRFDEGSGAVADDATPNGDDGALVNAPPWVVGHSGYALQFGAGSGRAVTVANNQNLNPTAAISAAAWVNAANWSGAPFILQKGAAPVQYRLYASGGNLVFDLPGVGTISAPAPSAGAWHFVAGTYDGANLRLYVDGAVVASTAASGSIGTTTAPLVIGAADATGAAGFDGRVDEVRLFGRGLTADEVQGLYTLRPLSVPTVLSTAFRYQTSPNAVTITLSEDVSASGLLSASSLVVTNADTGNPVNVAGYAYDAASNTLVFTFAAALPAGNYTATLRTADVKNADGITVAGPVRVDFFAFPGDANHDRVVNFDDLLILAKNYNSAAATFAQGDFNYDGTVNFDDLLILAKNYNSSLPATGSPTTASALDVSTVAAAIGSSVPTSSSPKPVRTRPPVPAAKPPSNPAPAQRPLPKPAPQVSAFAKPPIPSVLREDAKAKQVFSIDRVAKPAPVGPKRAARVKGH